MLSLKTVLAMAGPMAVNALSGSGHSTRYWDCCKTSCAWSGKADVSAPVLTCDANDNPISNADATSGCDGGGAFACSNNSPWAVNDDLAFGFAATALVGGSEDSWCCACYALTFTTGPVAGKTMVVQSTNTGGDLSNNHFDIQMPGGGLGIFDGCTPQFGSSIPGERYGGVTSRSQCDQMPELLKDGCYWRFDWFQNADNPDFTFEQVQCPKEITDVTGCTRGDDGLFPKFGGKGKPAPGGEEAVKPTSTKGVVEATKAPDASVPETPKPVDETDKEAEKPEEDETVKPVEEEEEVVDEEEEEVVDEDEEEEVIDDEEDCEEEGEEVIEDEDDEEIIDDEEDCEEDNEEEAGNENEEVIEDGDDEEDCEKGEEIIEEEEDEEPVEEQDDEEEDEEVVEGCPAPAPQPGTEAALYHQCGGKDWTGPTKCAKGSKCEHWNPYYFQCIPV